MHLSDRRYPSGDSLAVCKDADDPPHSGRFRSSLSGIVPVHGRVTARLVALEEPGVAREQHCDTVA